MPRARNKRTEKAIVSAAWELFFKKGYAGTSYTGLALRSGVSRPLVQRYFPRKELLVERCVRGLRAASVSACDERFSQELEPLARLYVRSQVTVATYFVSEGTRRLMLDVFSDRMLTQQTIKEGFEWSVSEVLPDHPELVGKDEPDELIMAAGGLYELIYVYLSRGAVPDIAAYTLPTIAVFGRVFGLETSEEQLRDFMIEPDELERLSQRAIEFVSW